MTHCLRPKATGPKKVSKAKKVCGDLFLGSAQARSLYPNDTESMGWAARVWMVNSLIWHSTHILVRELTANQGQKTAARIIGLAIIWSLLSVRKGKFWRRLIKGGQALESSRGVKMAAIPISVRRWERASLQRIWITFRWPMRQVKFPINSAILTVRTCGVWITNLRQSAALNPTHVPDPNAIQNLPKKIERQSHRSPSRSLERTWNVLTQWWTHSHPKPSKPNHGLRNSSHR